MTPDHSDKTAIESRLKNACAKISKLEKLVGVSKTVINYDSDRRKQLLAKYAAKHLKAGESSAAAETLARADEAYGKELDQLQLEYESAEKTLAENNAAETAWETFRSLLAMQRETFHHLKE